MTTPMTTSQPEHMLTLREVGERLRVSEMTVRRLVEGETPALRSVKIGRLRRVPDSALTDYMRSLAA